MSQALTELINARITHKQESCKECGGKGYTVYMGSGQLPEQEQCEYCARLEAERVCWHEGYAQCENCGSSAPCGGLIVSGDIETYNPDYTTLMEGDRLAIIAKLDRLGWLDELFGWLRKSTKEKHRLFILE